MSSSGCSATRILRPPENTSTVPSSLRAEERAVGRRRLGELLDLLAQGGDVLARLAEGVGELLVLRDGLGQLALGLEQPLLERAHPLGRLLQPAPQLHDLLLERLHLLEEGGDLLLVGTQATFVLGVGRGNHLLDGGLEANIHRPLFFLGRLRLGVNPSFPRVPLVN